MHSILDDFDPRVACCSSLFNVKISQAPVAHSMGHQNKDQKAMVQFPTNQATVVSAAHPHPPIHLSNGYKLFRLWAKVSGEWSCSYTHTHTHTCMCTCCIIENKDNFTSNACALGHKFQSTGSAFYLSTVCLFLLHICMVAEWAAIIW